MKQERQEERKRGREGQRRRRRAEVGGHIQFALMLHAWADDGPPPVGCQNLDVSSDSVADIPNRTLAQEFIAHRHVVGCDSGQ